MKKSSSASKSQNPLVGKFCHSLEADRKTIKWQAKIKAEVGPGLFLIQLFEWFAGTATNEVIVPVADMVYWPIYDSVEEMTEAYRAYDANRKARGEEGSAGARPH